ncbi:MAG: GIY-YIG nuclease family protein, partial [Gammaproteobacteria bacterium]|nr:GIY-YIG nuclease family protein [Gammaproteobacteria bacterium]
METGETPEPEGPEHVAQLLHPYHRSYTDYDVVIDQNSGNRFFELYNGMSNRTEKCDSRRCKTCHFISDQSWIISSVTGKRFRFSEEHLNCSTTNVVYLIECNKCDKQYVGETKQQLKVRFLQHYNAIRRGDLGHMYEHFRSARHSENDMNIRIIDRIIAPSESVARKSRLEIEDFWIRTLNTAAPWGLNIKISGYGNISESLDPLTTKNHPYFGIKLPRVTRGHGKRRRTNKLIQTESLSRLEKLANCEMATILGYYVEFRKLSKKLLKHLLKIINNGNSHTLLSKHSNFCKFFISYISGYFPQH